MNSTRKDGELHRCGLRDGSWDVLSTKIEAVHGAVPLDMVATVTGRLVITLATVAVGAGVEAGPEGEDSMAENSSLSFSFFICRSFVVFLNFFFHLPSVGTRTNCWTVFFLFFTKHRKNKRFFRLREKKDKHEDPFLPRNN
jgi:hypothetical protein